MTKPTDEYRRILHELGIVSSDESFGEYLQDEEDDPFNLDIFENVSSSPEPSAPGSFAEIFDGFDGIELQFREESKSKEQKSTSNDEVVHNVGNKIDKIVEFLDRFYDGNMSAYEAIDKVYSDMITLKTYFKLNPISASGNDSSRTAAYAEIRELKKKLNEKEREFQTQKREIEREIETLRSRLNTDTKELRERLAYYEKTRIAKGEKRKVVRLDHIEE